MADNSIGKSERPASGHSGGAGTMPPFLVELARNAPAMMWTFTSTTFLSALLLFAIQPMFAKTVLPVLGGSPSVWSVSIFFFQAALLAGYLYAHLLINKAPPHLTGIIQTWGCAWWPCWPRPCGNCRRGRRAWSCMTDGLTEGNIRRSRALPW